MISVLNVIISTPESRGGAIRAGLQFGEHISKYVNVDNLKMEGIHDKKLQEELGLSVDLSTTPSRTLIRDVASLFVDGSVNYENTLIGTEFSTPKPLTDYDLVHIHNAVPLWGLLSVSLQCRLADVPYVMTTHGISKLPNLPQNGNLTTLESIFFRHLYLKPYLYTLQNAAHLFSLSEKDKEILESHTHDQDISVLPNGVSINQTDKETQEAVAEDLGLDRTKPILFFVGKIMESKGVRDLLDIYDDISYDCTLVIAGPPKDNELVDLINENPQGGITYLGYLEQKQLDALFSLADLFVFPTHADVFPLVTLEAMAAGTPIVSTNVGGLPEQISDQTGILVDPESPTLFADAIDKFLTNEMRRRKASDAAFNRVKEKFSWEVIAEQATEKYMEILKKNEVQDIKK